MFICMLLRHAKVESAPKGGELIRPDATCRWRLRFPNAIFALYRQCERARSGPSARHHNGTSVADACRHDSVQQSHSLRWDADPKGADRVTSAKPLQRSSQGRYKLFSLPRRRRKRYLVGTESRKTHSQIERRRNCSGYCRRPRIDAVVQGQAERRGSERDRDLVAVEVSSLACAIFSE